MGFFDFLESDAGGALIGAGVSLLAPTVNEWINGSSDPDSFSTPQQLEASRASEEARQFQLAAAKRMLPFATPEAQEAIVRREAARGAYETDLVRRRQVARGVNSPFTGNYYDNIDPIVRRAADTSDPVTRAMNLLNQAGATAGGVPSYTGPPNAANLARAEDLFNQGSLEQLAGQLLTPETINLLFGSSGSSQVSGFDNTGGGSSDLTFNSHGNPF